METETETTGNLLYTCIACRVAFKDSEIQRQHYKSDWHRYNLKRKVVELPPVTVEEFQKKLIIQREQLPAQKYGRASLKCKVCKKSFSSSAQHDNHVMSKKHKENCLRNNVIIPQFYESDTNSISSGSHLSKSSRISKKNYKYSAVDVEIESETMSIESVDSDEWLEDTDNLVKNNICLFCNHQSRSMEKNLKHMTDAHSFFIPDPEYCTNVKGLLEYLGEKIFAGYVCLWCNDKGKAFQSVEATRNHMIDKGHCKMLHEGEALLEYADFYDYSSSYPDAEEHDADEEIDITELDGDDYQLVLPSGNVIGHRSLMRYYKQHLNPTRAVAISKNDKIRQILCQYRALLPPEIQKETVLKKIKDIRYMQRIQAKYSVQLQIKANKLQHHFRRQVNF
ncbi:zinc finger protein 622 [Chelonus insularis]|uniref:zinc finger protein 622 n=1 Tax=Chelonus insularis TaxID=460826 RepID=UPI00158BB2B0|nr:zinc finger protein 622 [Chelonus insularis]